MHCTPLPCAWLGPHELGMLSSSSTMNRSSAGQFTGINNQAGCLLGVNQAAFCCRHLFSFTISTDWWHSGSRGFGILLRDQFSVLAPWLGAGTALGQGCTVLSIPSISLLLPPQNNKQAYRAPRPRNSGGSELLLQSLQSRAP